MEIKEPIVEEIVTVGELLEKLKISSFNLQSDFVNEEELLFRGQGDIAFDIIPAIGRYPNSQIANQLTLMERDIYNEAKNAFPSVFNNELKPIDLLTKLQHYGIPTRLLDVTKNPLIALYFACSDKRLLDNDGEVLVFKNKSKSPSYAAIIDAIADTAYNSFSNCDEFLKFAMSKEYFINEKYALEVLLNHDSNYGYQWINECCKNPMFINRAFLTERQKLQQGYFLLFSNKIISGSSSNLYFGNVIEPIDKSNSELLLCRFIIPHDKKKLILEELDKMGINKRSLFADSVDIVCGEIKNHYISRYCDPELGI